MADGKPVDRVFDKGTTIRGNEVTNPIAEFEKEQMANIKPLPRATEKARAVPIPPGKPVRTGNTTPWASKMYRKDI